MIKKFIFLAFGVLFFRFFTQEVLASENNSEVNMKAGEIAEFTVYAPIAGLYNLNFEYLALSDFFNLEFNVYINGEQERRVIAPIIWRNPEGDFATNRQGHEVAPRPSQIREWRKGLVYDEGFLEIRASEFYLEQGENIIKVFGLLGAGLLREFGLQTPRTLSSYREYIAAHSGVGIINEIIEIYGQRPSFSNSPDIRLQSIQSPDVTPYNSGRMLLNVIGGGWEDSGQSVTYSFYAPQAGLAQISLSSRHGRNGAFSYRAILINGEIPFLEAAAYPFSSSRRFSPHTLSINPNEPFLFYFEQGYNEITLVATNEPLLPVIESINKVRTEIRDVALDIRSFVGLEADMNRDWRIEEFLPSIRSDFASWISRLEYSRQFLIELYGGSQSTAVVELNHVIRRLQRLEREPDLLPMRMSEFSDGSASAAIILTNLEEELRTAPLFINQIFVHSDEHEPPRRANLWELIVSFIRQFLASFAAQTEAWDAPPLEVWVSRSQYHLEVLQHLADYSFTLETGIPVRLSLIPNDTNIILANAGGRAPDAALGLSMTLPFQMAIRGASADLTRFEGFEEVISRFTPGAILPLKYGDGVFGLPETQDFYVIFYRTDLLPDFTPPDTWSDVLALVPSLHRNGQDFFIPLSADGAYKPFMFTAPFFYQFGADIYSQNGLQTAINTPEGIAAITFMTDLYTLYGLPFQVASFFNNFRYGGIPIGISNLETYIMLTVAAPEILGLWNIAPHPGIIGQDGNVLRYTTGSAQTAMLLEQSERQQDAFAFLDWWTRADTQTEYANSLLMIHGAEFLWSSANLEAFSNLPIPEAHKEVILYQATHLREVPLTPASYIIEREVSNIWNRVVFDGQTVRIATDRSVNIINREMRRRMEEFGYTSSYPIPTLESVRALQARGQN